MTDQPTEGHGDEGWYTSIYVRKLKFRNLASIRNEPFLDVGRYVMIKLR